MSLVKVLIVEDEMIIAEDIASRLKKSGYTVTDCVADCDAAIRAAAATKPDLILMDIHLSGKKDGIDAAAEIRKLSSVPIIFLTDHDDKKMLERAAKTNPSAYLLKPFNEKQIHVSIQQAIHNSSNRNNAAPGDQVVPSENTYALNNCLFIRKDKDSPFRKIPLSEVLFIEAERAYSVIHTTRETYMQSMSMSKVFEQIHHPSFIQVHRSFIVNIDNVEGVKGNMLLIKNKEIQVGESHKEDVMKRFPMLKNG